VTRPKRLSLPELLPLTLAALSLVVAAACGGGKEIEVRHAVTPDAPDSVYVEIVNEHFYDARVYVLYEEAARRPLGLVVGNTTAMPVAVPWQPRPYVFEISFIAESGLYYTEDVVLEPGDVIRLRIPPNIATSAFFRRAGGP
jgi:hypothetical protein